MPLHVLYQAQACGATICREPVCHGQLCVDASQMKVDGSLADEELVGNDLTGAAFDDQRQDLDLSLRQLHGVLRCRGCETNGTHVSTSFYGSIIMGTACRTPKDWRCPSEDLLKYGSRRPRRYLQRGRTPCWYTIEH